MAMTDRVMLFHDFVPHGTGQAVVHGRGLGVVRGVVPLPHATTRLDLADRGRMQLLVDRFRPSLLVPLVRGVRVDVTDGAVGPAPAITPDGSAVDVDGHPLAAGAPS